MSPEKESAEIVRTPRSDEFERSINSLGPPMVNYLQEVGLPTDNILASLEERRIIINSLADALNILPIEERRKAYYLTKFTVAVSVGLFDGALNYLWNETVGALRRLVAKFDLAYFFSVAEKINSRYKNFSKVEELDEVEDHTLLEACRRIGLISDINYRRLEHVNYMRNHASAAHPNENEIAGFEMLSWLSNCIKCAITAEPEHSVIQIQKLLENIRTQVIPISDVSYIGNEIARLSQERIDDLLWTLFGMFVDPKLGAAVKTNIGNISKYVWDASTEDRKYEIGSRYGMFRKNAEVARKDAAEEFLNIVHGQQFKDEDSLAGELIEKLETLKSVHFGFNNFYNEHPHAKALENSLPPNGIVPRAVRPLWVKVICLCAIGNGYGSREGVDESAMPYYRKYIRRFGEAEIIEFLHLMSDTEFTSPLALKTPERRLKMVADSFKRQANDNIYILKAIDTIINASQAMLVDLGNANVYKNILVQIPRPK